VEYNHVVGARGGSGLSRVIWIPGFFFWACVEPSEKTERNRHWLAYGLVDPRSTRSNLNISVETCLPRFGTNRRVGGLLAKDEDGNVYLLHSGNIRGGKKGVGKVFFWKHYRGDRVQVQIYDDVHNYALIGRLDTPNFIERLADFVHGVDALRTGKMSYHWRFPTGSALRPFKRKSGGTASVEVTKTLIIRNRTHDRVLNALRRAIESFPNVESAQDDAQRDLFIKLKSGKSIDLELKVRDDRYEIYTGVGQLLLNRNDSRASTALVTPDTVSRSEDLIERLRQLSISHVGYSQHGRTYRFSGLEALLKRRP
jgi:hypothetical protein